MSQYNMDTSTMPQVQATAEDQSKLLCVLIEGIGKHAIEEDAEELARYRQRLNAESDRIKEAADRRQLQPVVEAVVDLVAQHNEAVKTDHRAHTAELNQALRMMTETIGHVGKSSQAAVHQLGVIEKGLEEATATNDITRLRARLGVCLTMIREQSESLKVQSEEHVSQLKAFVSSTSAGQQMALLDEPLDALTGLPARSFAENLMKEKFTQKADCLVGVLAVNRLAGLRARFGHPVADEVMQTIAQQLATRLPVGTTLCRWSQNAFIAVTGIVSSYAETAQQWRKVGAVKIEREIDDQGRTAFITVTTAMTLEHVRPATSKRELIQNLDRFVAQQSGESSS